MKFVEPITHHESNDLVVEVVVAMPKHVADPADTRPIDAGRDVVDIETLDAARTDRRFADDQQLPFHGAAHQFIVT